MVTRRDLLTLSGLSAASLLLSGAAPRQKRPNILFVFTDQQTYRAMGCAGNPHLSTPAMDRLAAEGVRFEKAYLGNYYRMTERVDAALNRVLTALDSHGLTDNTLVLFTSDHGDGVASHRWTAKLSLYEEATRIPFILRWPKRIPAGRTDRVHLTSQLDVLPTLCDYAGIPRHPDFRGRSVKTIIDHPNVPWRDYVVTELADDSRTPSRKGRMLRSGQYKYTVYSHGARNEQLFDLIHDPGETQNLAYEPALQAIVKQHREWLHPWMEKTHDTF